MLFLVNDTNRGPLNVAREYIRSNRGIRGIIMIDFKNRREYSRRTVNRILKDMQNPPLVKFVSDLPKPQRMVAEVDPKDIRVRKAEYLDSDYYNPSWWSTSYSIDSHGDAYFVNLNRSTIVDDDFNDDLATLKKLVIKAMPGFFEDITVCGIPKAQRKKLEKAGIETKPLIPLIKEKAKDIKVSDIMYQTYLKMPGWANRLAIRNAVANNEFNDPDFKKVIDMYESTLSGDTKNGVEEASLRRLKKRFDITFSDEVEEFLATDHDIDQEYEALNQRLFAKYPMIEYFDAGWSDKALGVFTSYVNEEK